MAPELKLRALAPSNNRITETTPTIQMAGDIRNFESTEGCDLSFETTLLLRR